MARLGVIHLAGRSGRRYRFSVYPIETVFREGFGAVYVVTRRNRMDPQTPARHHKLRLGRTGNLRGPLNRDRRALASGGANCICVHREKDKNERLGIQRDLVPDAKPSLPS